MSNSSERHNPLYPPRVHLEMDERKSLRIMETYRFATMLSAPRPDEIVATNLPLILQRERGPRGTLFGHLDSANPHARLLDGRPVTVLFHGPNAYLSPKVLTGNPLPTWNSISVHVRGTATLLNDREQLLDGIASIAEKSDPHDYELDYGHPRIDQIIGRVTGFEIEIHDIVGRFKVSQDLDADNRARAAEAMAVVRHADERAVIEDAFGITR
ncbi:FMN-binding negative transcriptional regulator [Nocardia sp. CDC153]|uniref:FMN-binding negative transcriptional regulator n=1 Tax=Nocardia sp. CDC153 TaxID=3112167 RepID=UPI002DBE7D78|nr:FMN-binding negative transcriptional regulator [Nocardia sp. CDC153]MEC3956380.1 FMN-binding negative transcriptional regulator [Nocardia sp. CDC153]